ncbi:MAG: hypothetical protein ACM4D3_01800 [Candidatus Sericytochromatia bacterium]
MADNPSDGKRGQPESLTELAQRSAAAGGIGRVISSKILADGSELVFSGEFVEVGDRGLPRQVIYRRPADKRLPAVEIVMEVWDGVPEVVDVRVSADRERRVALRVKDIRIGTLDLAALVPYWLAEVAVRRDPQRGVWLHPVQVSAAERRAAANTIDRARRRRLSNELLEKVAVTYRAASVPKHEAVAWAFDVSERTAQRYIAAAKRKGLIGG